MLCTADPITKHILLYVWTKSRYSFLRISARDFVLRKTVYHMRIINISVTARLVFFFSPSRCQVGDMQMHRNGEPGRIGRNR